MTKLKAVPHAARTALCCILGLMTMAWSATADVDQKFELFQVGTQTYTNVTVTTKAPKYVFIVHDGGMANVKVTELSDELQQELGYKPRSTNNVASWAKQKIAASIETPQVKELEERIMAQAPPQFITAGPGEIPRLKLPGMAMLATIAGVLFLLYLFYCYCCMLIVKKTGQEPGVMVWIPGLQMFPLLKAAGMSSWWFLAFLVPALNIVAQILWSIKIAEARGKSVWVGIMLIVPGANFFAFLYLAFSNGAKADPQEPAARPQLMTLETA